MTEVKTNSFPYQPEVEDISFDETSDSNSGNSEERFFQYILHEALSYLNEDSPQSFSYEDSAPLSVASSDSGVHSPPHTPSPIHFGSDDMRTSSSLSPRPSMCIPPLPVLTQSDLDSVFLPIENPPKPPAKKQKVPVPTVTPKRRRSRPRKSALKSPVKIAPKFVLKFSLQQQNGHDLWVLYVGNLPHWVTSQGLLHLFSPFGYIRDFQMYQHHRAGLYAYILYADQRDAERLVSQQPLLLGTSILDVRLERYLH